MNRDQPARTCHLCLRLRALQRSHFLPASLYKNLNPGDTSHVALNTEKYFSTSRQMWAHLLCSECEQRFSRNGEHWVMQNGYRSPENFRIQTLVRSATPIAKTRWGTVISGTASVGIDIDALCYFAMSIFWRGAVYRWEGEEGIDLGKRYSEEFRQYLMGASPFPANASMIIHVSNGSEPMAAAFAPYGGHGQGPEGRYCWYSFYVPGMLFCLLLGAAVPAKVKKLLCAAHSPSRPLCLTDKLEAWIESVAIDMIAANKRVRMEILSGEQPGP